MPRRPPPKPLPAGPGQESVWAYPRPPRLDACRQPIRVIAAGVEVVSTKDAFRVLETSHPPTYYLPPADFADGVLVAGSGQSFCEWKGVAQYWSLRVGDRLIENVGWSYPSPPPRFAAMKDHVALYAGRVDACYVGDEQATPQPGGFYGGWVTSSVVGPFKGEPGTEFW